MEIEELSKQWIWAQENKLTNGELNHWAIDAVIELPLDNKFDELWLFIKATYKCDISDIVFETLAAGPLEDLLAFSGEQYFYSVSELAQNDSKFRELLAGVWQNEMSNELWSKICEIR